MFKDSWDIKDANGNGIANTNVRRKGDAYRLYLTYQGVESRCILSITGSKRSTFRGLRGRYKAEAKLGPVHIVKNYELYGGRQHEADVYYIETELEPLVPACVAVALDQKVFEKSGANQEYENSFWNGVKNMFSSITTILSGKKLP